MSFIRTIRRPALVGAAALTALAVGAAPAMAHHCYVPMYSLGGPASANWFVLSAENSKCAFGHNLHDGFMNRIAVFIKAETAKRTLEFGNCGECITHCFTLCRIGTANSSRQQPCTCIGLCCELVRG